jgi:hypothetical protein
MPTYRELAEIYEDKVYPKRPCPNCGSKNFVERTSREYCPDCKILCDYWGQGSNAEYDAYCERKWASEEAEDRYRRDRERREMEYEDGE